MNHIPQVRSGAYLPFVHFMEGMGPPVERHMGEALVPTLVHGDPETLVPIHLVHAFLDKCARAVGCRDFGFVAGQDASVTALGAFGRSLQRSLTLNDALGTVRSKFGLYSSAERIWWFPVGSDIHFCHAYVGETGPGSRYGQQCALLFMRDIVRLAAGPHWQPSEVLSTDPCVDAAIMSRAFDGARVRQSKANGFVFPAKYLTWRLNRFQPNAQRAGGYDPTDFGESAPSGDFAGSVRQVVSVLLRHGHCQLKDIAKAVGMHPRTLQRRLAELNTEFSDVLAQVRFEAAVRLVNDPNLRVVDIAYELGYTDPANFTRAFRHWTGVSPTAFRRLQRDRR